VKINAMMKNFRETKSLALETDAYTKFKSVFAAASADDAETKRTIESTYRTTGELLDPHTAVGVSVAARARNTTAEPMVVLATAHPAKFPDAVKAATGIHPALPTHMADLFEKKERFEILANDVGAVRDYLSKP
jgi:threonine synthase